MFHKKPQDSTCGNTLDWIQRKFGLIVYFITGKERMLLGLQNTVDATDVFVVVTICFG